jgi:hypothetical protein
MDKKTNKSNEFLQKIPSRRLPLIFSLVEIVDKKEDNTDTSTESTIYTNSEIHQTPTHLCSIFYKPISKLCKLCNPTIPI